MARPATLVAAALALCLLLAPPGLAWYKPAAGRSSYSVGRAAGLLSGFRRSPYARRSQPHRGAEPPGRAGASPELQLHPRLRSLVSPAGGPGADGGGGAAASQPLPARPRPCASRTSLQTCRGASGCPTTAGPSSARRTSSCPCAQPTAAPPEPGTRTSPGTAGDPRHHRPTGGPQAPPAGDGAPALPYSAHPAVHGKQINSEAASE